MWVKCPDCGYHGEIDGQHFSSNKIRCPKCGIGIIERSIPPISSLQKVEEPPVAKPEIYKSGRRQVDNYVKEGKGLGEIIELMRGKLAESTVRSYYGYANERLERAEEKGTELDIIQKHETTVETVTTTEQSREVTQQQRRTRESLALYQSLALTDDIIKTWCSDKANEFLANVLLELRKNPDWNVEDCYWQEFVGFTDFENMDLLLSRLKDFIDRMNVSDSYKHGANTVLDSLIALFTRVNSASESTEPKTEQE